MEVVLHLRSLRHRESGAAEDRLDAQPRARDGMQAAGRMAAAGQRDVDRAGGQLAAERDRLEFGAARVERRLDPALGLVDRGAGGAAFLGRNPAETLQQLG